MATHTHNSQTITYRGPTTLVGALAHLLREQGVDFERPREDRTTVAEVVEVTLTVRLGDTVQDRSLDDMVATGVATSRRRFGPSPATVTVGAGDGP